MAAVRLGMTALTLAMLSRAALGGVTDLAVMSMDCEHVPNFVVNDVTIDFAGQWTGAMALVQLTSGSIYQHEEGGAIPLDQAIIDLNPSLECDTFVAVGFPNTSGPPGEPSLGGGAVNLGGGPGSTFNTEEIDIAWNPAGGLVIVDQDDFFIGRFTLSKDASGTAAFLAGAGGDNSTYEFFVRNGVITAVPEPGTMMLVLVTIVGWCGYVARRGRVRQRGR